MPPLPLDSPAWKDLRAHFANAADDGDLPAVPKLISRWKSALGSYDEEYAYEPLAASYLHQRTVTSVAYAVVPHLAERLHDLPPDRRLEILDDIAEVEEVRHSSPHKVARIVAELETKFPTGELRDSVMTWCAPSAIGADHLLGRGEGDAGQRTFRELLRHAPGGAGRGVIATEAVPGIGTAGISGETDEDRFFGVVFPGGVKRITMSHGGGIEIDHLGLGR